MKRNPHHDDLRAIDIGELRSRIDESLTSLDQDKGTDGEKFMEGMLSDLDSQTGKSECGC